MQRTTRFLAAALALLATPSVSAAASGESQAAAGLSLELNRLEQNGEACRATFVAQNRYGTQLGETAFELVLFDQAGLVSFMTVFDFGALAEGKTVVRRFDLPQTQCGELTRILVNGVARCAGESIDTARCQSEFTTRNRTDTDFGR